jgi:hypothetical protein
MVTSSAALGAVGALGEWPLVEAMGEYPVAVVVVGVPGTTGYNNGIVGATCAVLGMMNETHTYKEVNKCL